MSIFLYLSLLTISFLLTLKLLFKSRALKNLPPGPPYLPLIGNLHQLKQPFHRAFYELSRKYGKVFSLWFGSRLVVVVSSQTAAQECFSKNDIVLANRPHFLTGKYIGYNNTTLVLSPYGDHWRNLRRIATLEVLSTHRINSFLEIRRDEIMRLVQKLAQECSNGFNKVELRSKLSEMTFNTIMRMVSGKRYYGEDCDVTDVEEARRFRAITKELVALGGANNPGDFISVLRWFDFDGLENKLKRISKRIDSFLQGLIDEHRNGKRNTNTMIDHLLTQQQSHPEYYTDQIIKGLIMVMLLAGTDTSSVTLEWAMSNLLNHPEILERARKEIDTKIGQDHLIDESDISKLNYLQNIVYETFRLHPAAPLLVPHLSSEDCTLEGYKVPQNTIVLVNAWAIHRDPKLWSDDSTQFKPERFEKEGEINNLLTFGIGRRACPGANLAQRTVNLTLGLLIQCFEWERTTHAEIDMAEGKGLTVSRKIPLEAMCKVMLLAGTDTSSVTLEWAMSNLLNHPEIIKKARKEIDTQIGQDRIVDESDITNTRLPYLQNIVNETFRLHPAAPLLVPHYSSEDCTLEGYKVPQNTIVLVNAWAIHRDPKVWSDDSTQFKPERFEKEGEANNLLTFGMGRRACPGANLAQRTVTLTLGLLIQCFQWKRITSQKIDMTEDKGLTMPKKIPLETMCRLCDEQFATRIFYSKTLTRDPS
ncbi:Cytochrome P450 [Arachis hypogaea]|nr:Cytochrome P450 [Arachis hypogaea]